MAGVLYFNLLLILLWGSFMLITATPGDDGTTVKSDAAFTTTKSLFSARKTNTTEAPTTAFTAKSTTKPPGTTTTTEALTKDPKAAERTESRKVTEEEEGPLELGELETIYFCGTLHCVFGYVFDIYIL